MLSQNAAMLKVDGAKVNGAKVNGAKVDGKVDGVNINGGMASREAAFLPLELGILESIGLNNLLKHQQLLHKGEHVYHIGEPCHALFVVRSGSIKGYIPTNWGDENVQGFHLSRDLIGLEALSEHHYFSSAVALEVSTVYILPIEPLEKIYENMPSVSKILYKLIGSVIDNNHMMFTLLGKKNSMVRVATLLLSLSTRYCERGYSATEFCLTMTRRDIGNYLGLAEETVSRIFTQLNLLGILTADKKQLKIHDIDALSAIAADKLT